MGKPTKLSFAMTEQIGWEVITLAEKHSRLNSQVGKVEAFII